jgi:hypothetical protein
VLRGEGLDVRLLPLGLGVTGQLLGVEVRVADQLAAVRAGLRAVGPVLQLGDDLGVLVDAHDDEVARVAAGHDVVHRGDLLEDDLDLPAACAVGHGRPHPVGDQLGGLAPLAAAEAVVLPDDDDVEVLSGNGTQLAHVVVATVAGGTDHADA